jgi:hypothetical protein
MVIDAQPARTDLNHLRGADARVILQSESGPKRLLGKRPAVTASKAEPRYRLQPAARRVRRLERASFPISSRT